MSIPITNGTGQSSVAAEAVSGLQYQQIQIYGKGGASIVTVNPDGSAQVSVVGTVATTISGNPSVSGTVGASVIGLVPVQLSNTSVITVPQSSSVISVPVGSTIAVLQAPSIVGTYAEDAVHATGDKGLFTMGVRNDTLSSVTSGDSDYSPFAVGPTGEMVVADAPFTKWLQGTADLRGNSGGSVTVIAAQGASIFTYIREVQVANMGSASVLVTFSGATSSIIGYTIAPAGGGSNYTTRMKTNANGAFSASISGVASVLVTATGFIAKT